jgi:hypothetical protein
MANSKISHLLHSKDHLISSQKKSPPISPLTKIERVHYRDRLRNARYAALADAEGFVEICYAIEALGLRLLNNQKTMGDYKNSIEALANESMIFRDLPKKLPSHFTKFDALYTTVRAARNDAMHTGAYARHATQAAIELCIGLEDALMTGNSSNLVADVMIKSPMTIESWQPVGRARQLMLMHSFSFLPVFIDDKWKLVSELGLAKYLTDPLAKKSEKMAKSMVDAHRDSMEFIDIQEKFLLRADMRIDEILSNAKVQEGPMLWLVLDDKNPSHLIGVLSPFELM